ncbi:MAG: DUF58 domain-containing protein [Acidimicrobiales bacterium]|nr:DUF58 domain-containing protein [Acidimicrobiales bacterium]
MVVYIGRSETAVVLATGASLMIAGLVDLVLSVVGLRRVRFAVTPFRTVGDTAHPPTVRVHQMAGPHNATVQVAPLRNTDPQIDPVPARTPRTVALDGWNPHSVSSLEFTEAFRLFGFVEAKRKAHRPVPQLICRGPDAGERLVEVPHMSTMHDLDRLREYVPGDRMGRVNWSATARTTQLHVRDEQVQEDEVLVVVSMDPANSGSVTGRRMVLSSLAVTRTICEEVLRSGRSLRLATEELSGSLERARLLAARRVDKKRPLPKTGLEARLVERLVIDEIDLLKRLSLARPTDIDVTVSGPHVMVTLEKVEVNL